MLKVLIHDLFADRQELVSKLGEIADLIERGYSSSHDPAFVIRFERGPEEDDMDTVNHAGE